MIVKGLVCNITKSFFTVKIKNKQYYFYLQRNLARKFQRYLKKGVFVYFHSNKNKTIIKNISCYTVTHFVEISLRSSRIKKIYYSMDLFREGIKNLFSNLNNVLFIDFEFNMVDYYSKPNFNSEIIEVGYALCDKDLNLIEQDNLFLKPTTASLTKRTIKFLNYKKEQLDLRVNYRIFYKNLKRIVNLYNPSLIVWGKNDIDLLKQSFKINKQKPINFKFIDLSNIYVNYFNLKQTPGLFKMASTYNNLELEQKHNALEDALVTKYVFSNFKKDII